ncbi:hypothetical protein IV203_033931 [Nitzschia inconspicua]|uniref:GCF C-terminal domain-containing protein n=1 Tax=Nitzschia inconspicua TaxID=303405 RepID=A0A9K3M3M0_9STRA|nr:hypothetical protein IV203_033931 [Nitzschia inconspicua]
MFRSTTAIKKKKSTFRKVSKSVGDDGSQLQRPLITSDGDGDDNNQEEDGDDHGALQSALLIRKKQKVAKKGRTGLVVRSFELNEDGMDDDTESNNQKRLKKKRKRGLGFGGGGGSLQQGDHHHDDPAESQGQNLDANQDFQSSYGKEALEELKAEQKRQKLKMDAIGTTGEESTVTEKTINTSDVPATEAKTHGVNSTNAEESFISLQGGNQIYDTTPYTTTQHEALRDEYDLEEMVADPEESELWNEQIEKRAGIKSYRTAQTAQRSVSKLVSSDDLSCNLQSTIQSMQIQQEELQNSINRRKADREHVRNDSIAQEETLKTAGTACEYYQKLRYDLTLWVGALRDLCAKITPIQQAFLEMLEVQCEDVDHELRSWQDDCIAVLQEQGMTSQILGRQPEIPVNSGAPSIDEFGRDIKSQYLRDRDLRFQHRQQKLKHDNASGDEPSVQDICNCLLDDHNETERCETLNEAFRATMDDLDQDYTSSQGLKDIFDQWKSQYVEDYKQCYASLSLGDLYAIFLQMEICKSSWFVEMITSGSGEYSSHPTFPKNLESMLSYGSTDDEGYIQRSVEKSLVPMLSSILQTHPSALLFLSRNKSYLMSRLMQLAVRSLPESPRTVQNLEKAVSEAIARALDGIAIPIVNQVDESTVKISSLAQSSKFATTYLAQILGEMLYNMIFYWFPLLPLEATIEGTDGLHAVLNFINEKFLMLLSSLDKKEDHRSKQLFSVLWQALRQDQRNLLEAPSLLLLTLPLRAAGRAYQLDNATG